MDSHFSVAAFFPQTQTTSAAIQQRGNSWITKSPTETV